MLVMSTWLLLLVVWKVSKHKEIVATVAACIVGSLSFCHCTSFARELPMVLVVLMIAGMVMMVIMASMVRFLLLLMVARMAVHS